MDPSDLKRVLTHLKVTFNSTGKKELQTLLRDSLPPELTQKLQEAESALQHAGEASAHADADDLGENVLTLEPKEALQFFNKLDIERAKSVLAHYKVPLDTANSGKKQLLQLPQSTNPTARTTASRPTTGGSRTH